ncbi:molybdopterin molybdotransferase MoeA [Litoreibacter roseus]|uniref:Molybdopterin molybdenumtransferase n=1 Tax=Litoreibacter roseus TaxID=2601869 RepID=A0A6N6JL37_9RHOB|nr:gephyrin-like molybdotransferase Glp [Litoreibacter roseus]GFE66854.1 molybdopterin molybdenumtransferase MoeA [Litoreibacter roseus]
MISTAEALEKVVALATPMPAETVSLAEASGRVLAKPVIAAHAQPPFAASAMDGYAIADRTPKIEDTFNVVGTSAAGHGFDGSVANSEAVRIFTGAPVPPGTARVILQEDVAREGDTITMTGAAEGGTHIRPAGGDFKPGDTLDAPRRLSPSDIALAASMGSAALSVSKKPVVALIATGDELVMPGETPRADQIIASNTFGLKAMLENAGATARLMPIAKDTVQSLTTVLEMAADADLIVTIGGASVGDHDLVGDVAAEMGLERAFYKVAMRPGKPLLAGRMGTAAMVGLPGNPVSSMVCGEIFLRPLIDKMLGLPAGPRTRHRATLSQPIAANAGREHYMRAIWSDCDNTVKPFERQDSSLLTVLARANALLIRPPHDPAREAGEAVDIIRL